jgi:hypothetical protein
MLVTLRLDSRIGKTNWPKGLFWDSAAQKVRSGEVILLCYNRCLSYTIYGIYDQNV